MPRHVNPNRDRTATAPYNFVPLPEKVFEVEGGIVAGGARIRPWEQHDRFLPGTHSGWIDLEIETLTPLFIRGAVTKRSDGGWDEREARLRPEPYTTPGGRPAIPGSSLRGMLRALVEILAFAKIQPVSEAKPFYRTVAPDRIGRAYGERMRRGEGVQGGFLRRREGGGWVIERCEFLRVDRRKLPRNLHDGNTPRWAHQHRPCWVRHRDGQVSEIAFTARDGERWSKGVLVVTGDVPRKRREFVFLDPARSADRIRIPEPIWDRFHDQDQITQWQENAFPRDQPTRRSRKRRGHLRDGEPVFFIVDSQEKSNENPDGLVFLGRAGMFRLPYDLRPLDLVPEAVRKAKLDLAEAMFGRVGNDGAIKGRVFVEDAVAAKAADDLFEEVLVPRILSAPKPTTFQHYLTQDGSKGKDHLTTYLEGDRTAIRGHKLYWHRWDEQRGLGLVKEDSPDQGRLVSDLGKAKPKDTQHTIIRPVKSGVRFNGRIRFENLTDLELGALLAALDLPEGCTHRLGMGKPLGLGSVRITPRLRRVDRAERYRSWAASGVQADDDGGRFREAFTQAMLGHAKTSGETLLADRSDLRRIARIDVLFRLLSWQGRPDVANTAYMDLQRFRDRPVLPTPHGVAGADEPPWNEDPPRPGSYHGPARGAGSRPRSGRRTQPRRGAQRTESSPARTPTPPPPSKPKPVEKGQTRPGTLKRRGDRWVARFEGDEREARIINFDKIPAACQDGAAAEFYVTLQSKKAGIQCRFERLLGDGKGS